MMIVTHKHREKALEVLKNGDKEQSIKDTLKVIHCLVDIEKQRHVKTLYDSLFEAREENDSLYKKICRVFFR